MSCVRPGSEFFAAFHLAGEPPLFLLSSPLLSSLLVQTHYESPESNMTDLLPPLHSSAAAPRFSGRSEDADGLMTDRLFEYRSVLLRA
ncbi:uncharacterized protein V6R79_022780 [Siganus canaliculatus]